MEFWGAEVKPGKTITVKPEEGTFIHVSQACIEHKGEKRETLPLCVTVDEKESVIGTLSQENVSQSQISFDDLVFEKEFTLSNNFKKGSIFFIGNKFWNIDPEEPDSCEDSEDGEDETPRKTTEEKATPHPTDKGGKSPVNGNTSPKSGGQPSAGSNK